MARYIDADAVCDKCPIPKGTYNCQLCDVGDAPTADVVEVKHGRWEDEYGGMFENPRYRCSACGNRTFYRLEIDCLGRWNEVQALTDYCPNCGAKMDGVDDGEK